MGWKVWPFALIYAGMLLVVGVELHAPWWSIPFLVILGFIIPFGIAIAENPEGAKKIWDDACREEKQ